MSKPMGIKNSPPPAASPYPHCVLGPIKAPLRNATPHHTSCRSLFHSSVPPFALSPKLVPPLPYCLIASQVASAPPPSNFTVRFREQPSSFWSSQSEVWHPETPLGMSSDEPLAAAARSPPWTIGHRSMGLTHPVLGVWLCKIIHFHDNPAN
jgi:hypothetical protein